MVMDKFFSLSVVVFFLAFHHSGFAQDEHTCDGVDPEVLVLLPVWGDCASYYECLRGVATLKHCEPGFLFNEERQMCDFPSNVDCSRTSTTEPPTESTTTAATTTTTTTTETTTASTTTPTTTESTTPTTTTTTTSTTKSTTTPTTTPEPICQGTDIYYLPHPTDCTKYLECYGGHAYEMKCPKDKYYDDRTKDCVDEDKADCGRSVCYGVENGTVVVKPALDSCTLYWVCNGESESLWQCNPGFLFNQDKNACDFEENVDCDVSTQTPIPNTSDAPTTEPTPPPGIHDPRCTSDTNFSMWPHPDDCTKYIVCYDELGHEMNCPPGQEFSETEEHCTDPESAGCTRTTPSSFFK